MPEKIVASLIGYTRVDNLSAGFVLPIFQYEEKYFAQHTNQMGTIVLGFIELDGFKLTKIADELSVKVGVGDPCVFIFAFDSGSFLHGTIKDLYSKIEAHDEFTALPKPALIQLEKIFPDRLNSGAFSEFAVDIRKSQGPDAYKSYINSTLRANAWEYMESNYPKLMNEITAMEELSSIDFHVDEEGEVQFINHTKKIEIPHSYSSSIISHLKEYLRNFESIHDSSDTIEGSEEDSDSLNFVKIGVILSMVPRQEERIALIAIFAFLYSDKFLISLEGYNGGAKSEKHFLHHLRRELIGIDDEVDLFDLVMWCVRRSWSTGSRELFAKYFLFWSIAEPTIWNLVPESYRVWQLRRYFKVMEKVQSVNKFEPVKLEYIIKALELEQYVQLNEVFNLSRAVSELDFWRLNYREDSISKENYLLPPKYRSAKNVSQIDMFSRL